MHGVCHEKTDEELVAMTRENKDCFIYLMHRYEGKMKKYIARISGVPKETVDDLVQDVFLRVYLNLEKFDTGARFSPWIYRIAHNLTINFWTAGKSRQSESSLDVYEGDGGILKDENNFEKEVHWKMANEKITEAFENLQEKYGRVLHMAYMEQKSYKEIAAELDAPISTVGTLLSRGKKLFSVELLKIGLTPETVF